MDARRTVGWNLRRLRVERSLTIEELADRAGVDASSVARIERGSINSSIDMLAKLSQALRVGLTDLVADVPPGTKSPEPLRAGRKSTR